MKGLENNKIYYIVRIDADKFKLSNTLYDSTLSNPNIVGIASTGLTFGEIGLVNPIISAYRDSTLEFDISDASLAYEKNQHCIRRLNLIFMLIKIIQNYGNLIYLRQYLMSAEKINLDYQPHQKFRYLLEKRHHLSFITD